MTDRYRANYALLPVLEMLGPSKDALGIEWAEFSGDSSNRHSFEVPAEDVRDAYVELQVYDVGTYGHEVVVNDEALSGFDVPPGDGWQYWMDSLTGQELEEGTNTVQIRRDTESMDSFAVGNVVVNWKEPVG